MRECESIAFAIEYRIQLAAKRLERSRMECQNFGTLFLRQRYANAKQISWVLLGEWWGNDCDRNDDDGDDDVKKRIFGVVESMLGNRISVNVSVSCANPAYTRISVKVWWAVSSRASVANQKNFEKMK